MNSVRAVNRFLLTILSPICAISRGGNSWSPTAYANAKYLFPVGDIAYRSAQP
jgi:hypothetical protein